MTKKPAFSLLEVMVILLILAVTLAATAPMISKKMSRNVGTAEEPWRFNGMNQSISFNANKKEGTTLFIGTDRIGSSRRYQATDNTRASLYIRALGDNPGFMSATNNNAAAQFAQGADVQAISFARPIRGVGDQADVVAARIFGHIGMLPSQDNQSLAFPFFGDIIPRSEGMIIGKRLDFSYSYARDAGDNNNVASEIHSNNYNAIGDNVQNKLIIACDSSFSEKSFEFNNEVHTTAVQNRNVIALGNMIGVKGVQNFVAIGEQIASGWGQWANPISRSTVVNTQEPRDQRRPSNGGIDTTYHNMMIGGSTPWNFNPNSIVNQGNNFDIDLDDVNNDLQNVNNENSADFDTVVIGVTAFGGRNQSVGSRNTILGYNLHCGRVLTSTAASPNNGQMQGRVLNSVAIGSAVINEPDFTDLDGVSIGGAYGSNSVSIGNNCVAGTQRNRASTIFNPSNQATDLNYGLSNQRDNTVAIGHRVSARSGKTVAIGNNVTTITDNTVQDAADTSEGAVVIGNSGFASSQGGIAIGENAGIHSNNSVALGHGAEVTGANSVAIGANVSINNEENRIILGVNNAEVTHQVNIPGAVKLWDDAIKTIRSAYKTEYNEEITSDIRLKNVGEKFTSGLEDIKKLEFFNYTYKNDKEQKPHVGVMAQDLQKVFPISVTERSDGYLTIRWDEMFYAALNAIKELDRKIIALTVEVREFFSRVDKLDLRVAKHQAALDELKSDSAQIDARLARLEEE